jgi:hypothetical protein
MLPENFAQLHSEEEKLRRQAIELISKDRRLALHLTIIEQAMDIADIFRQYPSKDEDLKIMQLLGMRTFNAFGSGLKLALSGYIQNSALIMRDILETVFLMDLFRGERDLLTKWRFADQATRIKLFRPAVVREKLDKRDGHSSGRRAEMYKMFSELAGHPTMNSHLMMRPIKGGNAVIGPFIEDTSFSATIDEMGRLGVQVGEILSSFMPKDWEPACLPLAAFAAMKMTWFDEFYPSILDKHLSAVEGVTRDG